MEPRSDVPSLIDHATFMVMLSEQFPEVVADIDESSRGLLHCEMGSFAGMTEKAIDREEFGRAHQYFQFIDEVRKKAHPEVENAIDVSYIEYLAFSEVTERRRQALKSMPLAMREILLEIDSRGRWS